MRTIFFFCYWWLVQVTNGFRRFLSLLLPDSKQAQGFLSFFKTLPDVSIFFLHRRVPLSLSRNWAWLSLARVSLLYLLALYVCAILFFIAKSINLSSIMLMKFHISLTLLFCFLLHWSVYKLSIYQVSTTSSYTYSCLNFLNLGPEAATW